MFRRFVAEGSEVLELGIGPGTDLDILRKHYRAVGTDGAQTFLDIYRADHPDAELFLLDAVKMNTSKTFDGLFSNKVLIHLTRDELIQSFAAQAKVVRSGGIAVHSFWYGDTEELYNGLQFTYHTEQSITASIEAAGGLFTVEEMKRYTEMAKDDSLFVVLRRT